MCQRPPSGPPSGGGVRVAAGVGLGPQIAPAGCASSPGPGLGPGERTLTHISTERLKQATGGRSQAGPPPRRGCGAASTCARSCPGSGGSRAGGQASPWPSWGAGPCWAGDSRALPGVHWRWECWLIAAPSASLPPLFRVPLCSLLLKPAFWLPRVLCKTFFLGRLSPCPGGH